MKLDNLISPTSLNKLQKFRVQKTIHLMVLCTHHLTEPWIYLHSEASNKSLLPWDPKNNGVPCGTLTLYNR